MFVYQGQFEQLGFLQARGIWAWASFSTSRSRSAPGSCFSGCTIPKKSQKNKKLDFKLNAFISKLNDSSSFITKMINQTENEFYIRIICWTKKHKLCHFNASFQILQCLIFYMLKPWLKCLTFIWKTASNLQMWYLS